MVIGKVRPKTYVSLTIMDYLNITQKDSPFYEVPMCVPLSWFDRRKCHIVNFFFIAYIIMDKYGSEWLFGTYGMT
jgi:hypothetical protein